MTSLALSPVSLCELGAGRNSKRVATREEIAQHFKTYGPMVFRRAYVILGQRPEAQDATQEVFVRALRSAERFEERSKVSTWLYTITTNYCLNLIRDRARRAELFEGRKDELEVQLPGTPDPDARVTIRKLLAQADERQAQVAVYIYFDELSREEVAKLLGVSVRTVGNLLDRFNKWARKRLEHGLAEALGPRV